MVSLRSGKRTNRLSAGTPESNIDSNPIESSTPRRSTKARKVPAARANVFDETATNPEKESSPVKEGVPSPAENVVLGLKKVAATPVKKTEVFVLASPEPSEQSESPDVCEESGGKVAISESLGLGNDEKKVEKNDVDMLEETVDDTVATANLSVGNADKSDDVEEDTDNEDDDDDDMPMEISSKKEIPKPKTTNFPSKDDESSDVTSKTVPNEAPKKSVVEQLLERKADKAAKLAAKKLRKRSKKKESKKIADGFYQVKLKKSSAKFNVVTLKSGVTKILEPEVNFREQLLSSRTSAARVADSQKFQHRAKWVKKRS